MKNISSKAIATMLLIAVVSFSSAQTSWLLGGNTIGSGSTKLGSLDNKALQIITNNKNRLKITGGGLIGIGTTSPATELHLVGTLQIDRSSINGNTTPAMILNGLTNNIVTVLMVDGVQKSAYGYDVSTNDFVIATDDVGLRPDFIINRTNGYVGLNTKTPGARLHIQDGDIQITNVSESFFIRTNSLGQLQFIPNNSTSTAAVTIDDNNSNVGIGTSAPSNKLDVQGGAVFFGNIGVQTAATTNTIQCGLTQGALIGIGTAESIQDAGSSTLSINADWLPRTDNLYGLGISSYRWTDVWAQDGTINTSDATLKTNVVNLKYGLDDIMKLRPVSYQWKTDQSYTKLGVIAQEIQQVLPEVVRDWEFQVDEKTGLKTKVPSSKLGVMYDDIIPVLIKGIQEQQDQIEDLKNTVDSLQLAISSLQNQSSTGSKSSGGSSQSNFFLDQNVPNPASHMTTIRFTIPASARDAQLVITDVNGKIIEQFDHLSIGQSQVEVSTLNLVSGTYQYSLYADGKKVDTKQMIISK